MRFSVPCLLIAVAAVSAGGQTWKPLGPPGGDVRTLAIDPSRPARVFLGTADGHIFGSEDSGGHWALLGRASSRLDAVITAIVVDPGDGNVLFASSWTRNSAGGGVFRSVDGGRTWSEAGLAEQAVRTLAMAPSDSSVLVAGTLDGVYRSRDAAKSWKRISPEHDEELRNLDSLAIDPRDPQIIYAGTFHLPWKTTDGGRTWRAVHDGMIDDSDVMSMLIDKGDSRRVYASACSGIYRSEDGAGQWKKIQGIPYTARRTYAITQDPKRPGRLYAATSEGLWKTDDAGMTWRRKTPESWVVNTVVVAGAGTGRVLIGTEKLGVLASGDGGEHFEEANMGFDHRQILALGVDPKRPGHLLVVVGQAPEPILVTEDGGRTWSALGPGLRAERVSRVYAAPDGAWWASVDFGGLMRYDQARKAWKQTGTVRDQAAGSSGGRKSRERGQGGPQRLLEVVTDMAFASTRWFAATSDGLLVSSDLGATWTRKRVGSFSALPLQSVRVSSNGDRISVVALRGIVFSDNGGSSWDWHDLPLASGGAVALNVQPGDENTLIATARNGLYISRDAGRTWQQAASGLPSTPVQGFAATGTVFVSSMRTGGLYISSDSGRTWDRGPGILGDSFFAALTPSLEPGVFFAASSTEGLYRVEWYANAANSFGLLERTARPAAGKKANPVN